MRHGSQTITVERGETVMMTSRERLRRVLNHESPDRIPVDFGSTPVTGIHVRMVEELRRHFGLPDEPVKVVEPYQMLGEVDDALALAMGVDVVGIPARKTMFGFENRDWREFRLFWGQTVLVPDGFRTTLDGNGDLLIYPEGDLTVPPSGRMPRAGFFFDAIVRQDPIDEARIDPVDNVEEFTPLTEDDLAYWRREIELHRRSDRALIVNVGGTAFGDIALVPGPWMKRPRGVRDIAEWYMATLTRPEYVHAIFDRQVEVALKNLDTVHGLIGDEAQAIFICGTDFGTQDSQFCSIETFRDLYLPYYRQVNDYIHRHTRWKTFKHSCGAIEPLIPSFIDAGFDILNPVQVNAAGMDPAALKAKYGQAVVFWGGGVDTQKALPFATPREVTSHVLKQCEILGRQGGFVFNAIHNVQANVPVENVVAMIEAVKTFNGIH
jgi:hypothetical protein